MQTVIMVTILQNSLAAIYIDYNFGDGEVTGCWVWMMKNYSVEESWSLLFRVDHSRVLYWPVGFKVNGELVMETRAVSLVSYDPKNKQVKDLGIHGCKIQYGAIDSFYLGKYVESLVLLDRGASAPVRMGSSDGSLLI